MPHSGHGVLTGNGGRCGRSALADLLAGRPQRPCGPIAPPFSPSPLAPTRLRSLPGRTRARKTLNAVRATLTDVQRHFAGDDPTDLAPPGTTMLGLRAGRARRTARGLRLRRLAYVPGVGVSGTADLRRGTAVLSVGGRPAAHGTVRYRRRRIVAKLGGHRLTAHNRKVRATARGQAASAVRDRPGLGAHLQIACRPARAPRACGT